jgi:hypothetical protein
MNHAPAIESKAKVVSNKALPGRWPVGKAEDGVAMVKEKETTRDVMSELGEL